jgi:hypothetical protein
MPKTPGARGTPPEARQAETEAEAETKKQERAKKIERLKDQLLSMIHTVALDPTIRITTIPKGMQAPALWFYSPTEHMIYFDPDEVFERTAKHGEEYVLGIIAHEAAHAVISDLSVVPESVLKRELGFLSTLHAVEERPTDYLVGLRAPAAHDWLADARRISVKEGEGQFLHEEIKILQGYYPRFGELANIIVFDPYAKSMFEDSSPEAQDAFEEIERAVHSIERMVPKESGRIPEERKIAIAKKRYGAIYRLILPHVRELVRYDEDSARMHEVAKHVLGGIISAHDETDADLLRTLFAPETDLAKDKEELLSPELEAEMLAKMKGSLKRKIEFLSKKQKEKDAELPPELIPESVEQEDGAVEVMVDADEEERDLYLASIADLLDQVGGAAKAPLPVDDLSPELQDRLLELYDHFSEEMKQMIEELIKKILGKMDEDIGKSFQEDTGGEPMDMSGDKDGDPEERPKEEGEKEPKDSKNGTKKAAHRTKKELKQVKGADKALEKIKKQVEQAESDDHYHQVYKKVQKSIDELSQKLYEIFHPQTSHQTKLRRTGTRPFLPAVFRRESAIAAGASAVEDKIFEVKEIPKKSDVEFVISVDMSGSMYGEGIKQTFKGVVLLSEVLNKLGIKFSVDGFYSADRNHGGTDVVKEYKGSDETLTDAVRAKMLKILDLGIGNPTALAIEQANKRLSTSTAKNKFILILTDGGEDRERELTAAVDKTIRETDHNIVGVGLGEYMSAVTRLFPASIAKIPFEDVPDVLASLLRDIIENPQKYKTNS